MAHLLKGNSAGVDPVKKLFTADALLVDLIQAVGQCGIESLDKSSNYKVWHH